MLVNTGFLALLMVAGNAFMSVAADDSSVSDKELDNGYYECKRGECQWNCPKDWCWVAYNEYNAGYHSWKWLSCNTAKDCERYAYLKSCKHIAGGRMTSTTVLFGNQGQQPMGDRSGTRSAVECHV